MLSLGEIIYETHSIHLRVVARIVSELLRSAEAIGSSGEALVHQRVMTKGKMGCGQSSGYADVPYKRPLSKGSRATLRVADLFRAQRQRPGADSAVSACM